MNKLLALATAGALAFGMVAATAVPSQAAKWQNQNWQGQQWKKGGQNFQKFGNFQGHKFKQFHGGQNFKFSNNNWKKFDGPKNYGNWKPSYHGNYPKVPQFKKYTKYPKHHHQQFNPAPFIFGFALGAIVSNAYAYDYGLTPHQLWCLKAYPNTYNPATNLFYIRPGVVAVCVSPYSGGGPVGYFPY